VLVNAPATICRGSTLRYPSIEIRGFGPVLQQATQLERKGGAATPDDHATETAWMQGRGEERGAGADVGADHVGVLDPTLLMLAHALLAVLRTRANQACRCHYRRRGHPIQPR
jgi:hypothetical protein